MAYALNVSYTVTSRGPLFTQAGLSKMYSDAGKRATMRIATVVANGARNYYSSKRLKNDQNGPLSSSLIFASIMYPSKVEVTGLTSFTAIVFAGNGVPYAQYVHDGHTYSNGTVFEGYPFMKVGIEAGEAASQEILQEEFSNL